MVKEQKFEITGNPAALSIVLQERHGATAPCTFLEDIVCKNWEEASKYLVDYRAKHGNAPAAVRFRGYDVYLLIIANAGDKLVERKVYMLNKNEFSPIYHWYCDCVRDVSHAVQRVCGRGLDEDTKELMQGKRACADINAARAYLMEERKKLDPSKNLAVAVKYWEESWLAQYDIAGFKDGSSVVMARDLYGISFSLLKEPGLEDGFVYCNNADPAKADRICRISIYEPKYIGTDNKRLGCCTRYDFADVLASVSRETGRSNWQELLAGLGKPEDLPQPDYYGGLPEPEFINK